MKNVLLVDDTQTILMTERMMLSGMGFNVDTAENGQVALERITARRPDLILLDIMMPVMDGIEFCRRVRSQREYDDIPIIMVTTKGEEEKVQAAFEAGCNDYLTKPINKVLLLSKIRMLVA